MTGFVGRADRSTEGGVDEAGEAASHSLLHWQLPSDSGRLDLPERGARGHMCTGTEATAYGMNTFVHGMGTAFSPPGHADESATGHVWRAGPDETAFGPDRASGKALRAVAHGSGINGGGDTGKQKAHYGRDIEARRGRKPEPGGVRGPMS